MNRNSLSTYDAMLSDEGDLYSDDDDAGAGFGSDSLRGGNLGDKSIPSAADRRAHHNALERKRRDHIKDSFSSLRDSVPSLQGEKVTASRAQILKKAAEYIQFMRKKNTNVQQDIDEIAKQNKMLEDQIRRMEKHRPGGGSSGGTNSSLSSLFAAAAANESAANDVSTSYDISENSNNSSISSSVGGGAASSMLNGSGNSTGCSVSGTSSSSVPTAVSIINGCNQHEGNNSGTTGTTNGILGKQNGTATATIINGTVQVRPVTMKTSSGTISTTNSKIIVQNPQHKNVPHVIHVTTTSGSANGAASNIAAMSSSGTPIIISSHSLVPSASSVGGVVPIGSSNGTNGTNGSYVISKGAGAISLQNGFRTLVVQQAPSAAAAASGSSSAVTTTPNIHILGTIPSGNYSKQQPQQTKKLKISNDTTESLISGGGGSNGTASVSS